MTTNFRIIIYCTLVLLFAGFTACDENDSGSVLRCGPEHGSSLSWHGLEHESTRYLGYPGTTSSVLWDMKCEEVCTATHSRATVTVHISKNFPQATVEASVWYGILHEPKINLTKTDFSSNIEHKGTINFGIRDVYGEDPGMFIVQARVNFPSTGDYDQDVALLNDYLVSGRLDAIWDSDVRPPTSLTNDFLPFSVSY